MARPKLSDENRRIKQDISIAPAVMEKVLTYCQQEERSISWVYEKAVIEWLAKKGIE